MSSTRIEALIDEVQAAFDRRPTDIETGLDVEDAALLQLRKACRLLAGAEALRDASYYTLVIEASFVAIERTVVTPEKVTRTKSGGVNLADDRRNGAGDGTYPTGGEKYEVTYEVSKPESGEWTVRITPQNVMHFGYEITKTQE